MSRDHQLSLIDRVNCGTLLAVLGVALVSAGCVTKSQAQAQARAAYLAGQQEAMTRLQQAQAGGTNIRINGAVRIPILPWVNGLTLMKAIVTAEYTGQEPAQILVLHHGIATRIDVKKLLAGEDVPLQPGDVVQIVEPQTGPAGLPAPPNP